MANPKRIEIRCSCGQRYHADPSHVGRAIRCRCGQVLPIRAEPSPAPGPAAKARRRWRWPAFPNLRLALPRLRYRPLPASRRLVNLLVLGAWGYLFATVCYAALLWLGGDAWWIATVLLFSPRWPILLPALPLALVALLFRPRLLLPVTLAVLVGLGPGMGYRTGWRSWFSGSAERDLRVVTFNINKEENTNALATPLGLDSFQPDVVAFQECPEGMEAPEHWPDGWFISRDSENVFCFASRFPVLETRTAPRVRTGEQGGTGSARLYRIRTPKGPVDFVVIHLETPRKGLEQLRYAGKSSPVELNDLVRGVGSRRVSRWIAEQSQDAVVLGDFNMPVESTIYRESWSSCANAFSRVGHGFGWTRVMPHFSIRIDHVLTCGHWRSLRAVVGPDLGSDHRPLIVDLVRDR